MNEDANWVDLPIASVDVETTGLDPQNDRVIEIAIIHMRQGEVEDAYILHTHRILSTISIRTNPSLLKRPRQAHKAPDRRMSP